MAADIEALVVDGDLQGLVRSLPSAIIGFAPAASPEQLAMANGSTAPKRSSAESCNEISG